MQKNNRRRTRGFVKTALCAQFSAFRRTQKYWRVIETAYCRLFFILRKLQLKKKTPVFKEVSICFAKTSGNPHKMPKKAG